jgi:hypothetical protein
MIRAGVNQVAAPRDAQQSLVAATDERIGSGGRPGIPANPTNADIRARRLDAIAKNLQVLAEQIDGLTETEQIDAGQFMQLDVAARSALAAAHAINGADMITDTLSRQACAPRPGELKTVKLQPELASRLIQRIFAAGLHLTALQSVLNDGSTSAQVAAIVEELDIAIRDIRAGVLELSLGN